MPVYPDEPGPPWTRCVQAFRGTFPALSNLFLLYFIHLFSNLNAAGQILDVQPVPDEHTHLNAKNNFDFALTGCKPFVLQKSVDLYSDRLGIWEMIVELEK